MAYSAPDWQTGDIDWNKPFDFGSFIDLPAEDDVVDAPFG